jgi:hypothetical protein
VGTQGTLGTVLEGMDEDIDKEGDGQTVNKIQDTRDVITLENSPDDQIVKETEDIEEIIKPEDSPTHPLEDCPV